MIQIAFKTCGPQLLPAPDVRGYVRGVAPRLSGTLATACQLLALGHPETFAVILVHISFYLYHHHLVLATNSADGDNVNDGDDRA